MKKPMSLGQWIAFSFIILLSLFPVVLAFMDAIRKARRAVTDNSQIRVSKVRDAGTPAARSESMGAESGPEAEAAAAEGAEAVEGAAAVEAAVPQPKGTGKRRNRKVPAPEPASFDPFKV